MIRSKVKDDVKKQFAPFIKEHAVQISGENYLPVKDVNFICWSLPKYGDNIKLSFSRWGNGAVTTKKESLSTKFTFKDLFKVILDPYLTVGAEWSSTGDVQVVSTNKSVPLGSTIINYFENYNTPKSASRVKFVMKPVNTQN